MLKVKHQNLYLSGIFSFNWRWFDVEGRDSWQALLFFTMKECSTTEGIIYFILFIKELNVVLLQWSWEELKIQTLAALPHSKHFGIFPFLTSSTAHNLLGVSHPLQQVLICARTTAPGGQHCKAKTCGNAVVAQPGHLVKPPAPGVHECLLSISPKGELYTGRLFWWQPPSEWWHWFWGGNFLSPVNTSSVAGLCHGIQIQLTRVSCVNLGRMFNPLAPFAVSLRCKTASCCQGSGGGVATPFPEVVWRHCSNPR